MTLKRNSILSVTFYIISITLYSFLALTFNKMLINAYYYHLLILVPVFMLFVSQIISNTTKLLLTVVSMVFSRNDNTEVSTYVDRKIISVNRINKYVLIGIFIALLSSVMILDIILCVNEEKYELLAISIVIWILMYYLIFSIIIKSIKKEINL